ncbi:shikimate 5-dehydrogenase [Serratia ureilytica]|uniref:shikimate 5-dehydrogenase n=1 Tax=Serratia ureilytica TaxID=300181 RepID=UPI0018D3E070|nr:shikimate 5-dehydrogenase [Serratia ureilytica]MBH2695537.1 shikimate 5-dehydrogenase [Serratia marcescens]MBH1926192.1 shikimate 5-dehydrogenase [Serratia ureilytica]MBH2541869.1 shikimate 5-dehydrogenase [Serratia ureilytica]MBH2805057.1 shikimate 5-dehydrogenase [Serratia marcescens]MBN5234045.1 shikimate 5-dehydrogenase [Serratia marcescens]
MTRNLNKDTTICMSLAARPSNFGTRFHNYLYDAMGLDYLYKAFTTNDLMSAIGGVRALGIRGCAISMPFKEECIPMVDEIDASAKAIDSVNTIVNTNGHLKAYNTDYIAISTLLDKYQISNDHSFILRGSGGMAKAVACALKDAGITNGIIAAKNERTGRELADLYDFRWCKDIDGLQADLIINATPIGMANGADTEMLSFTENQIESAKIVFEIVALPAETPLLKLAKIKNKTVITGAEVFAIQAVEQFVLYTGVRPDEGLFQKAAEHARANP